MKKKLIALPVLAALFTVVVIVILVANFRHETAQNTYRISDEQAFPLVSFMFLDMETDPLFGYASRDDAAASAGLLLPVSSGQMQVNFSERESIKRAGVILESTDRSRLIDEAELDLTTGNKNIFAKYGLSVMAEEGDRYLMTVAIETNDGRNVYYPVILYVTEKENIDDKKELVTLASSFSAAALSGQTDVVGSYLSYDAEKAGRDLSYVNLHNSAGMVTWAGLTPKASAKRLKVFEWGKDQVSIALCYEVSSTYENESNDYYVEEDFTIRRRDGKLFILDYERTTGQRFDGRSGQIGNTSLLLGIQDNEGLQAINGETANDIFFAVDGGVWYYEATGNRMTKLLGYSVGSMTGGGYPYELRLVGVEGGKLYFYLLGYCGGGIHEGENAFILYEYDPKENECAERIFAPLSGNPSDIKRLNAVMTNISEDLILTVDLGGSIYSVDLTGKDAVKLFTGIDEEKLFASGDMELVAWEDGNRIILYNVKKGIREEIEEPEGLKLLGFIRRDVVYAVKSADRWEEDGFTVNELYDSVVIRGDDFTEKARYTKKDSRLLNIKLGENNVSMTLCRDDGNGWNYSGNDGLTLSEEDTSASANLIRVTSSEIKKNYYYINYQPPSERKAYLKKTASVLESEPARLAADAQDVLKQYTAASYGRILTRTDSLSEAIEAVYDCFGSVYSGGRSVWDRDSRALYLTVALPKMSWTEEGKEDVMAAMSARERAMDIFVHEGAVLGVFASAAEFDSIRARAANACEELGAVYGRKLADLGRCDISYLLYYINRRCPVLALTGNGAAYMITGYTSSEIVYYDPADRSSSTISMDEAREWLGGLGTYYLAISV